MKSKMTKFRSNLMPKFTSKLLLSSALVSVLALQATAQEEQDTICLDPIIIKGKLIAVTWNRLGTSFELLDEGDLEDRPVQETVQDVLSVAVNVTAPEAIAKAPTVRGVDGTGPAEDANAFFAGSRPRLGLSINGRPAGYNELVFGNQSLWDVESVALLRGAQSTLSGRNAIAGTLAITTKAPTFEREAAFEFSAGTQDQHRFSAMVNTPLTENLAFRFAADVSSSQSTVNYTAFPGAENPGAENPGARETKVLRGTL